MKYHTTCAALKILTGASWEDRGPLGSLACGVQFDKDKDIDMFHAVNSYLLVHKKSPNEWNSQETVDGSLTRFMRVDCETCRVMLDIALAGGDWEAFRNGLAKHSTKGSK